MSVSKCIAIHPKGVKTVIEISTGNNVCMSRKSWLSIQLLLRQWWTDRTGLCDSKHVFAQITDGVHCNKVHLLCTYTELCTCVRFDGKILIKMWSEMFTQPVKYV